LCKDCARLGKEELAYRQAIRNLEQLLTGEGRIRRKKRAEFGKYLGHENERVRAYAHQLEAADALDRAEERLYAEVDELLLELAAEEDLFPLNVDSLPDCSDDDDTQIPF
jgi:hypothetical protein